MAIFNSYVKLPEGKKNADRNRPELGKKPRCRGVGGTKAGERGKATAGGPVGSASSCGRVGKILIGKQ